MKPDAWINPHTGQCIVYRDERQEIGYPQQQPLYSAATIRKWLEEVTPEMISAAIGRYLDVSKSHSYKGIYEAMIAAKLQSLEGGE